MDNIKLGKYKHYKGNYYEVIGFAKHSETLEDMVVYKALYGESGTWVRPASMWNEIVNINGKSIKRFEYIDNITEEVIEVVYEDKKIKVEHITSNGVASPSDFWYDNPIDEWVSITSGEAILQLDDKEITLKTNEIYYIKSRTKHRVKYTSPDCKWLCIYIKV